MRNQQLQEYLKNIPESTKKAASDYADMIVENYEKGETNLEIIQLVNVC